MTRKLVLLFLLLSLMPKSLSNAVIGTGGSLYRVEYKPGEILVKFKRAVSPIRRRDFHLLADSHVLAEIPLIGVQRIRISEEMSVEQAVVLYMKNPDVEYAEPNYMVHAMATPNDPLFGNLWGLDNANDHDIDAPAAWDITQGDGDVIIAVIDSGVAYDHADLQANIWTNEAEANGIPGVDDDGNGYVDDIHGWDFVDSDNDPMDYYGHGTHVAGTIAAVGDNGLGVTGVMWEAKIMPLRFLDAEGSGWTADAALAITYAVNNGAKILNNSWGGGGLSPTLEEAINLTDQNNLVFVAAAGNDRSNNDQVPAYPASYSIPNIISVAATDQDDNLATFSNYGSNSVHVAAPGVSIQSTIPAREDAYTENFDSGAIPNWTTGGSPDTWDVTKELCNTPDYSLTDSPGGPYADSTDNWAYTPAIDLSGKVGCKLLYEMELSVDLGDAIWIEASTDLTNWNPLAGWYGTTLGEFLSFEEDLGRSLDGTPELYVRFHLVSDGSAAAAAGAHIDDVSVTCYSNDYSADTQYEYMQGTSMATPHVAGLAGLILSKFPGLPNIEVKDRILNGVESKGYSVSTGGRINAFNSLNLPSKPTGLTAALTSISSISLTWNDVANEDGYGIERKIGDGGTFSLIATVGSDQTSHVDSGLVLGIVYHYRLTAFNTSGNSSSAVTSAYTVNLTNGGGSGGGCFLAATSPP